MSRPPATGLGEFYESAQPLQILFSEDRAWDPLRTIDAHEHDFFQLDYFYAGTGTITVDGVEFKVEPGELYFFNPGQVHAFKAAAEQPMQGLTFKFRTAVKRLPVLPIRLGKVTQFPQLQRRELHELLRRSSAEYNAGRKGSAASAALLLTQFFVLLDRFQEDLGETSPASGGSLAQLVFDYLRRHYHQPLTLADLGRAANLHPRYLCQKFTQEAGLPPMAALAQERVSVAKNLLASTRLPVKQIGAQVGYSDIHHFSKRFKALTGVSPNTFRAANQFLPNVSTDG